MGSEPKRVTAYRASRHLWQGHRSTGQIEVFEGELSASGKTVFKERARGKFVVRLSANWSLDLHSVLEEELRDLERETQRLRRRLKEAESAKDKVSLHLRSVPRET